MQKTEFPTGFILKVFKFVPRGIKQLTVFNVAVLL